MKQRIHWIDWLKFFAIALVVLGHCVQKADVDYEHNVLFRFIYSFHMPLFMAVSGYLSYKAVMTFDVVKKRFIQLMLPVLCWPLVWSIVRWDIANIPHTYLNLFLKPDGGGLWFLYTLFVITVIEYARVNLVTTCKSANRGGNLLDYGSILAIAGVLNLVLMKTNCKVFGFNFISWYYIFYSLGSMMRKNNKVIMENIKKIGIPSVIIFAVGVVFWNFQEPPVFYKWINLGSMFVYIYKLIVAVAGILTCFFIFSQFVNHVPSKIVSYVAGLTLGIYAVHQPILSYVIGVIPTMSLWMIVPLAFICTIAVTMIIIRLLQTNRLTSICMLGVRI